MPKHLERREYSLSVINEPTEVSPSKAHETMRSENGTQSQTDALDEKFQSWLQLARQLEDRALESTDKALLQLVHRFTCGIVEIRELLNKFQKSPGARITGKRGVAKQLEISRNAVYVRLNMVGLSASDFREPKIALSELILNSKTIAPLLAELKEKALD